MTTKTSQAAISTTGIDIGKNGFHVIGFDKRNVELLALLGQAISLSFKHDQNSRMRSMEIIKLIKSKL